MVPSGDDDTVAATPDPVTGTAGAPVGMVTGDLIGGRYRITRYLGGGGMGNVYAAVDIELGEPLAIKVLRKGLTDDAVERFRQEVRLQRRITHRNVARIFDIGEHRGEKLLTMELVDGESLSARLVRLGAMPLVELRALAGDILAGLAAAHAAGVIHLDLKPGNVLLARDGRAVIADFGIARAGVASPGEIAGTPVYMAPEQHVGDGDLDARADVYAFGVMLYELATGRRPFAGTTMAAIADAKAVPPDPRVASPALPAALVAVIQRCLAPARADRPQTADEVAAALERALRDAAAASGSIRLPVAESGATVTATVAVLPITSAPGDAYLASGLAEDLADALSRSPALRVLPATAVRGMGATGVSAGAALGVDHVVEGSLRRAGDKLRVAVRLVAVRDGFQVWADRRDTVEADLLTTGDELAAGLAGALSTAAARREEVDPRAVDLYLRGRHLLRDFWGSPIDEAITLLEEAAAAAPSSPTIVSTLATARIRYWMLAASPEASAAARTAAEHAIAVGPFHGEARYARGQIRINTGDLIGGAGDVGTAIRLAPMLPEAHYTAGMILCEIGAYDEGERRFAHCVELDRGMHTMVTSDRARIAALRGDFAGAHRMLDDLLIGTPPTPVQRLVAMFRGRLALWARTPITELAGLVDPDRVKYLVDRLMIAISRMVIAGQIDPAEWREQFAIADESDRPLRGRLVTLQILCEVAMSTGHPDLALEGLERIGASGLIDLEWLRRCPLFVELATEPRFAAIEAQVATRAQQVGAAYRAGLVGK